MSNDTILILWWVYLMSALTVAMRLDRTMAKKKWRKTTVVIAVFVPIVNTFFAFLTFAP